MKHSLALTSLFASAALLSACGGGGGGNAMDAPPAPAPSPLDAVAPQASQSAAGLKNYLAALSGMQADDREPVDLSTFAPPAADNTEPEVLS
jgi:hypothetical protein